MFCNVCGQENADGAAFCARCGAALPALARRDPRAVSPTVAAMPPLAAEGSDLMKAFIGPKHQAWYLERFQAIEAGGGGFKAGWHWPGFFVSWYWLLYRKMWLAALVYFFLPPILVLGFALLGGLTGSNAITGLSGLAYTVSIFVLVPMFATSLYYRKYRSVLARSEPGASRDRTLVRLENRGGTSGVIFVLVGVVVFVSLIGMVAAVAVPAYSDHVRRANAAGVVDAGPGLRGPSA